MIDELYQDVILDHYKHPRCMGELPNPSCATCLLNPLCGDNIKLTLKLDQDKISDISFTGHGCSISQASASMMCELVKGKDKNAAQELLDLYFGMLKGSKTHPEIDSLGDLLALAGVRKVSSRIRCAALAWEALAKCLNEQQAAI